ncbi:dopamine D2-like receptor [Littorina saxatilis]|uniref:dopamine D2-like receptor n=1 Tax=Littorina saxatilis TaxID=31220 RepID=UPI0038B4B443
MLESSPGTSRSSNDDVTTESTTQELDSYNVNEFLNQKNAEYVSKLVPTIVFLVVLIIVGMVGNSVVFTVYYKRFKPSVTRTYILALNVCAFLINVVCIPLQILRMCIENTFYSEWGCKTINSISSILTIFLAFVLVAVSVDRQNVICINVRHSLQYSLERAYVSILLCAIGSFILSVPLVVLHGNSKAIFADSNITGVRCGVTDEYKGSTVFSVYYLTLSIAYVLCVVIVSVSYGRIVLHLWRHKKTITARGITGIKRDYLKSVTGDNISSRYAEEVCSDRPLSEKAIHNSTSEDKKQAIPISETDITTPISQAEKTVCHVEEPSSTKPNNEAVNEGQEIPSSATDICTSLSQLEPTLCHVEESSSTLFLKQANPNNEAVNEGQEIPSSATNICTSLSQLEPTLCHVEESSSTLFLKQANPNNEAVNEGQEIPCSATDICTSLSQPEPTLCNAEELRFTVYQAVNEAQEIPCSATDICTSLSQPEPTLCHVEELRFTVHQAVNEAQATVSDNTIALPQPEQRLNQQVTIQNTEVRGQVRSIPSRTTFMLVVLTVVFVLNFIPHLYIKTIYDKVISYDTRRVNSNGRMISVYSIYVSSAVSPLVFGFCSGRFRYELCNLFRSKNM